AGGRAGIARRDGRLRLLVDGIGGEHLRAVAEVVDLRRRRHFPGPQHLADDAQGGLEVGRVHVDVAAAQAGAAAGDLPHPGGPEGIVERVFHLEAARVPGTLTYEGDVEAGHVAGSE